MQEIKNGIDRTHLKKLKVYNQFIYPLAMVLNRKL